MAAASGFNTSLRVKAVLCIVATIILFLWAQALSLPFSLLFGSGNLGDKMGVPSERGCVIPAQHRLTS